jgi:hypothetical protein
LIWTDDASLSVVLAQAGIHFAAAPAVAFAVARHSGGSRNPAFALGFLSLKAKRFVRYAAEFISFGKPQKKRTKEKRFSRHSNPIAG